MSKEYDEAVAELYRHLGESEHAEYATYLAGLEDGPAGVAVVRAWTLMRMGSRAGLGFSFRAALAELAELEALVGGEQPYAAEIGNVIQALRIAAASQENDLATLEQLAERLGSDPGEHFTTAHALLVKAGVALQQHDVAGMTEAKNAAEDLITAQGVDDFTAEGLRAIGGILDMAIKVSSGQPVDEVPPPMFALPDEPDFNRQVTLFQRGAELLATGSEARLDEAIELLREAVAVPVARTSIAVIAHEYLGNALVARFRLRHDRADIDAAIEQLEQVRTLLGSITHGFWADNAVQLGSAYWDAGHAGKGRRLALDGLRAHAWNTLLQPDLDHAQQVAYDAASNAWEVAWLALVDGMPDDAVEALESGRGLLLFATIETRDLARRLIDVGAEDLARQWQQAGDGELPYDLWRRMIAALTGLAIDPDGSVMDTPDQRAGRLLTPPTPPEIHAALARIGADALVYLVASEDDLPGAAVVVPVDDAAYSLYLPDLTSEPPAGFASSFDGGIFRDLFASESVVSNIGGWAWQAAIEPLLAQWDRAEPVRLVLVPFGELARIPWHAAHSPDHRHYAIDHAVFSYIPSARLLCDVAAAEPIPLGDNGLVVGDPDTAGRASDLSAARAEALAIAAAFYPNGTYLGRRADGSSTPAAGTRTEVAAWLADPNAGTVAHFACHGVTEPGNAYLALADGTRLTADELTETLTHTPGRDLAMAVLAACGTGRSARGYDEAFSLGSAFLAANVRTVISTLWSVPDHCTSVLMFMLHHFLRERGLAPADALRATQLWAVHDRTPPASMPDSLRANMATHRVDAVESWAAFVHFGQ